MPAKHCENYGMIPEDLCRDASRGRSCLTMILYGFGQLIIELMRLSETVLILNCRSFRSSIQITLETQCDPGDSLLRNTHGQ